MNIELEDIATEHYEVVVVEDPEHPTTTIYGLKNKGTDVIEYYDNLLPRVCEAVQHTEHTYKEMLNKLNSPELSVVDSDKDVSH